MKWRSKSRSFVLVLVRNVAVLVFLTHILNDVSLDRALSSSTVMVTCLLFEFPSFAEVLLSDSESRGSFTTVKMGERAYKAMEGSAG